MTYEWHIMEHVLHIVSMRQLVQLYLSRNWNALSTVPLPTNDEQCVAGGTATRHTMLTRRAA
jgi:hypothetical protein